MMTGEDRRKLAQVAAGQLKACGRWIERNADRFIDEDQFERCVEVSFHIDPFEVPVVTVKQNYPIIEKRAEVADRLEVVE